PGPDGPAALQRGRPHRQPPVHSVVGTQGPGQRRAGFPARLPLRTRWTLRRARRLCQRRPARLWRRVETAGARALRRLRALCAPWRDAAERQLLHGHRPERHGQMGEPGAAFPLEMVAARTQAGRARPEDRQGHPGNHGCDRRRAAHRGRSDQEGRRDHPRGRHHPDGRFTRRLGDQPVGPDLGLSQPVRDGRRRVRLQPAQELHPDHHDAGDAQQRLAGDPTRGGDAVMRKPDDQGTAVPADSDAPAYAHKLSRRDSLKLLAALAASAMLPALPACDSTSTGDVAGAVAGDGHWPELELPPVTARGYGKDPALLTPPETPWPLTLAPAQLALLSLLSDIIVPAEGQSPSASAVQVPTVVDEWVSAPYPDQQRDRLTILSALAWLDDEAALRFSRSFTALA